MPIEHVVVLCLENRSFDHMLGFLEHPEPSYNGLLHGGPHENQRSNGEWVAASPDAKPVLPFGPDHSHDAVMQQISVEGPAGSRTPTHQGFVKSYELKAAGRSPTIQGGVLAWFQRLLRRQPRGASDGFARGPLAMLCQSPSSAPVLSTLALEFAVCDSWYCSVPGETWPNRNYLHAANSNGQTNIQIQPYLNRTIFEQLEEHRTSEGWDGENAEDWRIYHDGLSQVLAFPRLWDSPARHARWYGTDEFHAHVQAGDLPAYSFIEPCHRPPLLPLDRLPGADDEGGLSDSQHPENNMVSDDRYDDYQAGPDTDFTRGERLIASVYESLRANPALFATTMLVITYDEHGGFYDHAPAPGRVENPGRLRGSLLNEVLYWLKHSTAKRFDFTRVGVRVPAVIVSPLIPRGTVEHQFLEHASVPATLRALFIPDAPPLGKRDGKAGTFHHLASLSEPREDLPDLAEHAARQVADHAETARLAVRPPAPRGADGWTPDYYREFLRQGEKARKHLEKLHEPEVRKDRRVRSRADAESFSAEFEVAARRHRHEQRAKRQ